MKAHFQNLFVALALCAGAYPAAAQYFINSSTNTVGSGPDSVIAADVNGDGKLDLICANVSGTLVVLTNNGSGGFVSASTNAVGTVPRSVCAADVNGDGKLDLISANSIANTLTVLTNNGSGGFGLNATYTVGNQPASVIAADLNGDGKLDLICANTGSNTLTVLLNYGGNFITATYTVGNPPNSGPDSVIAADVNGDGKLDLICANLNSRTLVVLTNNGLSGFVSASTNAVGFGPDSVIAADVNGDGKLDLICDEGNGGLVVLTNNGSGGFVPASTNAVGSGSKSVCAADVNGDGKLDLICANYNSGLSSDTLTVLTNNGSGGFVAASTNAVGGGTPNSVCAADVNGDGKVDLICANISGGTLVVLTNNITFPPPTSTPPVTLTTSGNGLVVSWPSASAGWTLQQSPTLGTSQWGPAGYSGYTISDDSVNKSLFIPSQPGNMFFWLMHP